MSDDAHRKRRLVGLAKLALAAGILGFLFFRLRGEDIFQRFLDEPKNWGALGIAQLLLIVAFSLSFVRWFLLVRALEIPFQFRDAVRLGSLGYMLNQVSLGSVGGDLFKAVCIAREQPGRRTEAIATVVIDRIVGLYAMLLVALCGSLLAWSTVSQHPALQAMATVVVVAAALGTLALVLLMSQALSGPSMQNWVRNWPICGQTLSRLVLAADAYRTRRRHLFAAIGIACATHVCLLLTFWTIGRGLPVYAPPLSQMCLVAPMSMVAGALPLTPSGLGTFEAAMEALFVSVGAHEGDGLLVAIAYRAMTYVMASIGAVYYLSARRKVDLMIHDAEELADHLDDA